MDAADDHHAGDCVGTTPGHENDVAIFNRSADDIATGISGSRAENDEGGHSRYDTPLHGIIFFNRRRNSRTSGFNQSV
jgi:hypothetical protein